MKSVDVTSCSHSQGRPAVRVTMSAHTVIEKGRWRVEGELNPQMLVTNGAAGYGGYALVDASVDLTASGRMLLENDLVEHEEIVRCTARLIANPVAHKLKTAEIDALVARLKELG